jgi:hypothetical protein
MRRLLPALTVAFALFFVAPAAADTFDVLTRGDTPTPAPCSAIGPGTFQCATLRDAVAAAEQTSGVTDGILLHNGGPYVLSNGQLSISSDMVVIGEDARSTVIQAGASARVLALAAAAEVTLTNVTIQGGRPAGNGGNATVAPGTTLALSSTRVTDGLAANGGGIANGGSLLVFNSLIDHNSAGSAGGGIYNGGSPDSVADVQVVNSTIAVNGASEAGGGIASLGNAENQVALSYATVARNTNHGLEALGDQNITAFGSLFGGNINGNCVGVSFDSAQFNVDDTSACGWDPGANKSLADLKLDAGLSDQGGTTAVVAFPAGSAAVDYVPACPSTDQRGYSRNTTLCDAGAYEQSGMPPSEQPPVPTPTPAPPAPTPTPTPTPTATPVPNKTVAVEPEGTVLIKRNGKFVPLRDDVVPNGAELDTKKGEVTITTAQGDEAKFFDGIFKVSQKRGLTTLTLTEKLDCPKRGKASAAAKKPKSRKLWGNGKGKFRTKGSYSAATVRGTKWLVQDTCTTTTTKVTQGVVQVEDFVKHKKRTLRKGKSYTARAKK